MKDKDIFTNKRNSKNKITSKSLKPLTNKSKEEKTLSNNIYKEYLTKNVNQQNIKQRNFDYNEANNSSHQFFLSSNGIKIQKVFLKRNLSKKNFLFK